MHAATPLRLRTFASLLALSALCDSADGKVMINEFFTGTPDFIELRNFGAIPVDVSGWTVQSYTASSAVVPAPEPSFTIPAGHVIPGYGFLVLQENGTAGQPGTLPFSIYVGFNYNWTSTRTVEITMVDSLNNGRDYVYLDWNAGPTAPHLPPGENWIGDLNSGAGDDVRRILDDDSDNASDWLKTVGSGTPGSLNPGQNDCQFALPYGVGCAGTGGFTPSIRSPRCPSIGEQIDLYIENGLGGSLAVLFAGTDQGSFPLGATGCTLNTSPPSGPLLFLPLGGYGAGGGFTTLSVVAPPGLTGARVTIQVLVQDPEGGGGIAGSHGAEMILP